MNLNKLELSLIIHYYELKTKQKGRNQDINVKEMANYREMKKKHKNNKLISNENIENIKDYIEDVTYV